MEYLMIQENKLANTSLTLSAILSNYWRSVGVTWLLTLIETALMALIPLLTGFAIDGLLEKNHNAFLQLCLVMGALICVGVVRRIYDTRAYGAIKVDLSQTLIDRTIDMPTSNTNARMDMGRELIDFLEQQVPELMTSFVHIIIAVVILFVFHPWLSLAAVTTAIFSVVIYALFHQRFFKLNARLNHQKEQQVASLESRRSKIISSYLWRLRQAEVKISDTESYVYGTIFILLLSFIAFSLWFSTTSIETSVGTIFSIVSYSWEFVESILVLPITLQSWSRLSEIIQRINR